jgi:polyisoprenoid-binding protein YceI
MDSILRTILVSTALCASMNASADLSSLPSGRYAVDPAHGYILFSYSHLGFSNPSVGFNRFETTLDLDSERPTDSRIDVTIDAASIDSRVEEFNEHLVGDDFFDANQYPDITFESTGIEATGDDTFAVTGNLTIKGRTKPVTLEARINKAAMHPLKNAPTVGITATGTLKRSDWGLDQYVPAVSDEVTLRIEAELIKTES